MSTPPYSDTWCDNPANVVKPAFNFLAHTAPLGIRFYYGSSLPSSYMNSAFIAFHGSWNRQPAAGYNVLNAKFDEKGDPTGEFDVSLAYRGPGATGPGWHRPVSAAIWPSGDSSLGDVVLVTSDSTGAIIGLGKSN